MKKFVLSIDYVEINNKTNTATHGSLPFHTLARSYEDARAQALDHAQALARYYDETKESTFYFRACKATS